MEKIMRAIVLGLLVMINFSFNSCSFLLSSMLSENFDGGFVDTESEKPDNDDNVDFPEENQFVGYDSQGLGYPYSVIQISETNFTLAWDTDTDSIMHYKLFIKSYGAETDNELDDILVSDNVLEYNVDATSLNPGVYVIGVAAVDDSGDLSDIHYSTDISAIPNQGWVFEII